ncbi:hypothetical protein TSAR_004983 [Trichomalopsis sarcophagae]|uniref:Uncharacterized protein n=1 Tax=Trichomalopsis sarcophagae TaxID=543379 RepID=A0A232EP14_9HYME|nr:hypothetical protein TSAR_004983 [Trichomalopsis sarcophagae]
MARATERSRAESKNCERERRGAGRGESSVFDDTLVSSRMIAGVISAGVSVPVQIPSQTPDLAGNYWPRLQ